jgi:hypothetical protein
LYLEIRYHSTDVFGFDSRHHGPLAQVPLALFPFARKQVALKAFVSFHLAAAGDSKSLRGSSVGFDFWHCFLLTFSFYARNYLLLGRQQHRHVAAL